MRYNVNLDQITVPAGFKRGTPREEKMNQCREYYRKNGMLDRDIVVNENMVLIDGYIGYLVLKENNVIGTSVVKTGKKKKYIIVHGKHNDNQSKIYSWRVVSDTKHVEKMKKDGFAIVRTSFGDQTIKIVDIEEVVLRGNQRYKRVVEFL